MAAPSSRVSFEELSKLSARKEELTHSHLEYMQEHPELKRMLNDFVAAVLMDKPDDVVAFAREHFATLGGQR